MSSLQRVRWKRRRAGAGAKELADVLDALRPQCESWIVRLYQLEALLGEEIEKAEVQELVRTGNAVETPVELSFHEMLGLARRALVNAVILEAVPRPTERSMSAFGGCSPRLKLTLHDATTWELEACDVALTEDARRRLGDV